ncbi:hypothetical protein NIES970_16410 [[Synechococcus] sp. NIES-970]|nr:hypothetical protein NIES970_16410 [[Synechococcus] sp. NIES-970]
MSIYNYSFCGGPPGFPWDLLRDELEMFRTVNFLPSWTKKEGDRLLKRNNAATDEVLELLGDRLGALGGI